MSAAAVEHYHQKQKKLVIS